MNLTSEEARSVWVALDKNGDGRVSYDEFIAAMRGPINEARRAVVRAAFQKLDANRNGVCEKEEIERVFNTKCDPRVVRGELTSDEALLEFIGNFEGKVKDGVISWAEFLDYYSNVSFNIDNDQHFEELVRRAWTI